MSIVRVRVGESASSFDVHPSALPTVTEPHDECESDTPSGGDCPFTLPRARDPASASSGDRMRIRRAPRPPRLCPPRLGSRRAPSSLARSHRALGVTRSCTRRVSATGIRVIFSSAHVAACRRHGPGNRRQRKRTPGLGERDQSADVLWCAGGDRVMADEDAAADRDEIRRHRRESDHRERRSNLKAGRAHHQW